jgi:hypothetical protein
LRFVSGEPGAAGEQPLVPRLRAVVAAKNEQLAAKDGVIAALGARLEEARAGAGGVAGTGRDQDHRTSGAMPDPMIRVRL